MSLEAALRGVGALIAYGALGMLMFGIWSGVRRPAGRTVGAAAGWLRSILFYLLALAAFLGISWMGWRALPWEIPPQLQRPLLILGALLYFPGMALILWGRVTLGRMYFVSTSFGAQLFSDHELVTRGPFAIVRHPMYLGLIVAAVGSLLMFQTWTTLAYALFAPAVLRRARREEQALAIEFGGEWQEYCRRVPAIFPWRAGR